MGRKTIQFAMGSTLLSAFVTLMAMCLPFNTVSFYSAAGFSYLGSLKVRLLGANFDFTASDFCSLGGRSIPWTRDFCEDARGTHDLQEMSRRFCAPGISRVIRNSCPAFSSAFMMGLSTFLVMIVNFVLQGIAAWLVYHYMTNSPKKKYREVSFILIVIGTALIAITVGLWFGLVTVPIDSMNIHTIAILVLDVSKGWSTSYGYVLLCLSLVIQIIQIVLYKFGKISDEARLMEAKMQQEFEAELAMAGGGDPYGGYDPYNQGNGNGYGGGDPYGQNPYPGGYQDQGYGGYAANPYGAQPGSAPPGAYQPQQMPASWGVGPTLPMTGGYR